MFRRGTLLFFRQVLLSEKFWDRTGRWKGYHDLPSVFFLSPYLNLSLRNPSVFQDFLVTKHLLGKNGATTFFCRQFLSYSTGTFRRITFFEFQRNSVIENRKFLSIGGGYHDFPSY